MCLSAHVSNLFCSTPRPQHRYKMLHFVGKISEEHELLLCSLIHDSRAQNKLLFAIQQRTKNEFTTFSHAVYFPLQKILVLILKSSRPSQCCSCAWQRRELNGKFTSASSIDVLQREHDSHVKITQTRAQQLNQTSCRMLLVCYAMSASL